MKGRTNAAAATDRDASKDKSSDDLVQKAISGSAWTFASQALRALAIFISTVVIARYVTPTDWGIAETAKPILVFLNLFVGVGMNFAIIQRKTISEPEINFLFWVNIVISLALACCIALASGPVATFFGEPALKNISYALSLGIIINGACSVHHGLLLRHGFYKQLSLAELIAPFFGAAIGITLAVLGYGYWAIIANTLGTVAIRSLIIVRFSNWQPQAPSIKRSYWNNVIFGSQMLSSTLLSFFSRNADNLIIAKLLGAAPLGFYSLAYRIMVFPFFMVSEPISRVIISSLSRLQDEEREYLEVLSKGLLALYLLLGFMAVLVGVFAEPLVIGLLGEKWSHAVILIQILAISIPLQALLKGSMWSMITLGKSAEFFKWNVFVSVGSIGAFVTGTQWGIVGVSIAYTLFTAISAPLSYLYAASVTKLRLWEVLKQLLVPTMLLIGALAVAVILKQAFMTTAASIAGAIVSVALTVVLFIGASCLCYWRLLRQLVQRLRPVQSAKITN